MADTAKDLRADPLLRDVPEHEGFKVLDRVVLYHTLGRGGFAVVYRGRHMTLDIDVAVKCLKADLAFENEDYVLRFQREAQQAARINHPNVVRVFDVDQSEGVHYIVMEFVEGENARARVQRKGQLSVDEALVIALSAARGLEEAHRAGLVHRDIKPDNILISARGDVKVADLGLARPTDQEAGLTLSGQSMGTPQYMPPEQFRDMRRVTASADVYALGATLYYLLTGRDGARGGSWVEILERIGKEPFPEVRERRPDVPEPIAKLIARCTSKDPEARPRDGGELVRLLAELVGTQRIPSDPDSGSRDVSALISPPPAVTLQRIRINLRDGMTGTLVAPTEPLGNGGVKVGRGRGWVWPAAIVGVALLAFAGWRGFAALAGPAVVSQVPRQQEDRLRLESPEEKPSMVQVPEQKALKEKESEQDASEQKAIDAESDPGESGDHASDDQTETEAPVVIPPPPVAVSLADAPSSDGRYYTQDEVFVLKGHVENARSEDVELTGELGRPRYGLDASGSFAISIAMLEAPQVVLLRAEGLVEPLELTFVRDTEPPLLEIVEPAESARRVKTPAIDLVLRVDDDNLERAEIESRPLVRGADGLWRARATALPKEGRNLIHLIAVDRAGNETTLDLAVVRDTRGPELADVAPPDGTRFAAGRQVEFTLSCDEGLASATVGGRALTEIEGRRASGAVEVPEDVTNWRPWIVLEDVLGNTSRAQRGYVVEFYGAPRGWEILDHKKVEGWARRVRDPKTGVVFLRVPTGSFMIGSPEGAGKSNEHPLHEVEIEQGFYLAETEITVTQWGDGAQGELAITNVSWEECQRFCERSSEGSSGRYRLPSESEWEYACRAGKKSQSYSTGRNLSTKQANVGRKGSDFDFSNQAVEVRSYKRNPWGFYDMHGNVMEWCQDNYEINGYKGGKTQSPSVAAGSALRVIRGGSFREPGESARSARRKGLEGDSRNIDIGLRPVFVPG
jgi:formylglycine-generating enzyme required for sulfatase activity